LKYRDFSIDKYEIRNGQEIAIINFKPSEKHKKSLSKDILNRSYLLSNGKIHINLSNYAIVQVSTNNESYSSLFAKETHPSNRYSMREISNVGIIKYVELEGKYYLSYLSNSYTFEDYGWVKDSKPKIITERCHLLLERIDRNTLSDEKLKTKYGDFLVYDDLRYQNNSGIHIREYKKKEWKRENSLFTNYCSRAFISALPKEFSETAKQISLITEKQALELRKKSRFNR
jgi:hypothetical protein